MTSSQKDMQPIITEDSATSSTIQRSWENWGRDDNLIEKSAEDMDSSPKRKWKWPLNVGKDTPYHARRERLIKTSPDHHFSPTFSEYPKVRQCVLWVTWWRKTSSRIASGNAKRTSIEGNLSSSRNIIRKFLFESCFCEFILKWQEQTYRLAFA